MTNKSAFKRNANTIGKKIGEWVIIKDSGKRKGDSIIWECLHINGGIQLFDKTKLNKMASVKSKPSHVHFARGLAKEKGLLRYENGIPCPQGHIAPRTTSNGRCTVCTKAYKLKPDNVKKELERLRLQRIANPEKLKIRYKKQCGDSKFRLDRSMRARVKGCLQEKYLSKNFQSIFGYSIDELRVHLERQFTKGMNWENYGKWHIDHILPVAMFKYTSHKERDFRVCWALSNLRPLWATQNHKKSRIRTHLI